MKGLRRFAHDTDQVPENRWNYHGIHCHYSGGNDEKFETGKCAMMRDDQTKESRIQRGFDIAPVPLNVKGKNRALVGLGSYIVNAVGDCNGCHSAGPRTEFADGGNPYLLSPPFTGTKQLNLTTYLGGGRDFGPGGPVLHLYSRNLTPDKTGLPAGGHTYKEFVEIMRRGTDFDHVHPNCTARHRDWQLLPDALQRRSAAGHAMAILPEHDQTTTSEQSTST